MLTWSLLSNAEIAVAKEQWNMVPCCSNKLVEEVQYGHAHEKRHQPQAPLRRLPCFRREASKCES